MDIEALEARKHGLELLRGCKQKEVYDLTAEIAELKKQIMEISIPFKIGDKVISSGGLIGIYGGVFFDCSNDPAWIVYEIKKDKTQSKKHLSRGWHGMGDWILYEETKQRINK